MTDRTLPGNQRNGWKERKLNFSVQNLFILTSATAIGIASGIYIDVSSEFQWRECFLYTSITLLVIGLGVQCKYLVKLRTDSTGSKNWRNVAIGWRIFVVMALVADSVAFLFINRKYQLMRERIFAKDTLESWSEFEAYNESFVGILYHSFHYDALWHFVILVALVPAAWLRSNAKNWTRVALNFVAVLLCIFAVLLIAIELGFNPTLVSIGCRGIESANSQKMLGHAIPESYRYASDYDLQAINVFLFSLLGLIIAIPGFAVVYPTWPNESVTHCLDFSDIVANRNDVLLCS